MTDQTIPEGATAQDPKTGLQFQLQRIYLKDLSFEAPAGVEAFKQQWQPKVGQELHTAVHQLDDNQYEVILKITVNVTLGDKTAFLVEVQQAGLFVVAGVEGPQLAHVVNTLCPQILFPYAREVIDNCAIKGNFPALALPPINFEQLFARAVEEARKANSEKAAGDSVTN